MNYNLLNCSQLILMSIATGIHSSSVQAAISKFGMPAMSPTMTEGTIIKWKKKEGEFHDQPYLSSLFALESA
jgi:hypothetical protein